MFGHLVAVHGLAHGPQTEQVVRIGPVRERYELVGSSGCCCHRLSRLVGVVAVMSQISGRIGRDLICAVGSSHGICCRCHGPGFGHPIRRSGRWRRPHHHGQRKRRSGPILRRDPTGSWSHHATKSCRTVAAAQLDPEQPCSGEQMGQKSMTNFRPS